MATNKIICGGEGVPNLKCLGNKTATDFYPTFNMWGNGHSTYCKKCLDKMFDYYYRKSGDSDKVALYYTLMQINTPFMSEIYDKIKAKNDKVTVNRYMTEFLKKTNRQTVWSDCSASDYTLVDTDKVKIDERTEQWEKVWGLQDSVKDYEFLEETFDEYTQDRDEISTAEANQYRWLCRDMLLLRKINDGEYNGEETIDKIQSRINKTMSILKIDRFEEKKKKSDIEKILEYQIWEIENTEPAEVVDKHEYEDYLNIKSQWGDSVLRAVKNLLTGSKEFPNITRDSDKY